MTNDSKPKNSRQTRILLWDRGKLDEWSARQRIECHFCGLRLDPTQGEAVLEHYLSHPLSAQERRDVEIGLAICRNWDNLSVQFRDSLLRKTVDKWSQNPELVAELEREGVVTRVREEH